MADPTAPDATPQADTGTGADNSSHGAPQGGNPPAQGDNPNPSPQADAAKPDGGTPPQGGEGGDPNAKPGDGKEGEKGGEKSEGPKADVQSAAEYGLEGKDDLTKWFADEAFKQGLTKAQATTLKAGFDALREQAVKANEKAMSESAALLMKDWGDDYQGNLALAGKTLDRLGTPDLKAKLDATGLGNDPDMVRVFHRIGKLLSEDSFITGATGGGGTNTSAAGVLYPNQK